MCWETSRNFGSERGDQLEAISGTSSPFPLCPPQEEPRSIRQKESKCGSPLLAATLKLKAEEERRRDCSMALQGKNTWQSTAMAAIAATAMAAKDVPTSFWDPLPAAFFREGEL